MRTKIAPLMTLGFLLAVVVVIMTCKSKPFDPCPPPEVRPEKPESGCCDSAPEAKYVDAQLAVFDTNSYAAWLTAERCPCDPRILKIDTSRWDPGERDATGLTGSGPEGIFKLPDGDGKIFGPQFHSQGQTTTDRVPDGAKIKVAILDSGLDPDLLEEHEHEIKVVMDMSTYSREFEDMNDPIGHGSAVFTVIDAHAKNLAEYYIYKCIDESGQATTYSIACALMCAKNDGADVINLSLGSYTPNRLLQTLIDRELKDVAIIGSRGNDCITEEKQHHFPSNYKHIFGIVALDADYVHPAKDRVPLWGCTNGSATARNFAAPSIITATDGEKAQGTSFAAAFVTGRFVRYLFGQRDPAPHVVFRDQFLRDTMPGGVNATSPGHYLQAAGKCVELTIIR